MTVTAYPDGPLVVRGGAEVVGEDGRPVGRPRASVALCRCGMSGRAPLCDGSHQVAARARRRRDRS
ncbi:CDGSH iron-sulfur domain-containing protein [Thalassiella azotivora]